MFPLVNLTKVSTAAHSMYFPRFQFQLGSPLILVTAPGLCRGLLSFLYSYCQRQVLGSRSLLVVCFTSTKSPRGPPWNEGHRPKVPHETSVLEVPAQEQHEHHFTLVLLIHLFQVLCTRHAGIAHHRALQTSGRVGLTPRQYTEWNAVGRARSTGDPSQQGLLPVVYRTASTRRCAHLHDRMPNKPTN